MVYKEVLKEMVKPLVTYHYKKEYFAWKSVYLPRLGKYKDLHKGEDCFIIANGPSIKNMDLSVLSNYHTFALNKAHLLSDLFDLSFSYHVCVDDIILEQMIDVIVSGKLNCTSFISESQLHRKIPDLPHIERLYTNGRWSFYTDIQMPISEGYTVTYVALQIAFYMGFQNIYLIGVDHSWKGSHKPNAVSKLEEEDQNHFHPDYFKGLNWNAPDIEGNEASYAMAKHEYHFHGREIYDATENGKLQIFQKIAFPDALSAAKKKTNLRYTEVIAAKTGTA